MTTPNPKRSKFKINAVKKRNRRQAVEIAEILDGHEQLVHVDNVGRNVREYDFKGQLMRSFASSDHTWFCHNDICASLGHANPRDAIRRLETDEKGVAIFDTPGGPQELNVVNESGLYALIFSSRKPQAREFRRWVTSEVLPALRKTGNYSVGSDNREHLAFNLDEQARYVVTVVRGSAPHIRKTSVDKILDEWSAFDTEILANRIRIVDALWQKSELVRSIGDDPAGSPLYESLGLSIAESRKLADEYLRAIDRGSQ